MLNAVLILLHSLEDRFLTTSTIDILLGDADDDDDDVAITLVKFSSRQKGS